MKRKVLIGFVLALLVLSSCATVPTPKENSLPDWVHKPYSHLNRERFVVGVGIGKDRQSAEVASAENLATTFYAEVQSQTVASMIDTGTTSSAFLNKDTTVRVSVDNLVGIQYQEYFDDGKGTIYCLSFIDREENRQYYDTWLKERLKSFHDNYDSVNFLKPGLLDRKNLISATTIRGELDSMLPILISFSVNVSKIAAYPSYAELATAITQISGFTITIEGDSSIALMQALQQTLINNGFVLVESNPQYLVFGKVSLGETTVPGNENKFCAYTFDVNIQDAHSKKILAKQNLSGREASLTYADAVERALRKIKTEFENALPGMLTGNV